MKMSDWAEQECRIACQKENPNFNFDSDDFDYGCSCYKSALKAYKSLCEDGHSGMSFSFTKNILNRLMDGKPLTPITDEDFFSVEFGTEEHPAMPDEWLKEQNLKSDIQCPRMSSLFRSEDLNGNITYHDNDRYYYIDVENPSNTFHSSGKFLDEMFPITMPYVPKSEPYKIYSQTFLTNKDNGDFDTRGILYVITPDGEKVDVGIYKTEKNHKWESITKEEYDKLLEKRIDKLNEKVASHLIWTLISNSSFEAEIEKREKAYKRRKEIVGDKYFEELSELCRFFENPDNYQYNTFNMHQSLCKGNDKEYSEIPQLVEIANYLKNILKEIFE